MGMITYLKKNTIILFKDICLHSLLYQTLIAQCFLYHAPWIQKEFGWAPHEEPRRCIVFVRKSIYYVMILLFAIEIYVMI